jgi:hypothetical protein
MRFYTQQHQFYCDIDLHARTMYLCIVSQDGEILVHRNMPAGPDPFLKAIAPTGRTSSSVSNVSSPGTGWLISVLKRGFPSCWVMPSP